MKTATPAEWGEGRSATRRDKREGLEGTGRREDTEVKGVKR